MNHKQEDNQNKGWKPQLEYAITHEFTVGQIITFISSLLTEAEERGREEQEDLDIADLKNRIEPKIRQSVAQEIIDQLPDESYVIAKTTHKQQLKDKYGIK